MSSENRISVVLPQLHPECSSCVFAKRADDQARKMFPPRSKGKIKIECTPFGGGSEQVKPGKWVEFEGRSMKVTPILLPADRENYYLNGYISICPHFPFPELDKRFPNSPELKLFYKDPREKAVS